MRESMARLTPRFSAERTVREYVEQQYLPAAGSYRQRAANVGEVGRELVDWQHRLEAAWATLRFGDVSAETRGAQHVFEVQVYLDGLDPEAVHVELYADGIAGSTFVRQVLTRVRRLTGTSGGWVYRAAVPATRPPSAYTARVIPCFDGVAVPLEAAHIRWQR